MTRFYRNHYHSEADGSAGFWWYTSKAHATRDARNHDLEMEIKPRSPDRTQTIAVDIAMTKEGVLGALRLYAIHPENG